MKLIKREEQKLMFQYHIGTIDLENHDTKEKRTYEVGLNNNYEPIIKFEDGDFVIVEWKDMLEFAEYCKKKCGTEVKNESNKDINN